MSLKVVSQLNKTVSALIASLEGKDVEIAKLKEELELQRKIISAEITQRENVDKLNKELSEEKTQMETKLLKKKFKLEESRNALKEAVDEKTDSAPTTRDTFIYVSRRGEIQAAESEKAAMEFFEDDFELFEEEMSLEDAEAQRIYQKVANDLAVDGESLLDRDWIALKRITVPEYKEETGKLLELKRKVKKPEVAKIKPRPTVKKAEIGKIIPQQKKSNLPVWMKIGIRVRYNGRNYIITDTKNNRIELGYHTWVDKELVDRL